MSYERTILAFFVSLITVLIITPLVKRLAIKSGVVDQPDKRKIHDKVMPRMGGLAIFIGVLTGSFAGGLYENRITAITLGAFMIVILGIVDDKHNLSARIKFIVQILVACIIVSTG
ncbi:undecaprenyl-phosphate alpha-N-acetylglucosaminyl 1-phosphate transferase, partial [Bacillus haynesii]